MNSCEICEQGIVLAATVKSTGEEIFICDECDAVWTKNPGKRNSSPIGFWDFAERYGGKGLWDELEVKNLNPQK